MTAIPNRVSVGERIRRSALLPLLSYRAVRSARYARTMGGPGTEFAAYGRRVAWRRFSTNPAQAIRMLLTPVSIVRYWEFPFAMRHLSRPIGRCLDVASPRLFSAFVASHGSPESIRILNPDVEDAQQTASLVRELDLSSIRVEPLAVSAIEGEREVYDNIWAISVLEHIPGDGDLRAVDAMWKALRPGGRLILTVPVDRHTWDEYQERDAYGLGVPRDARGFFFQRWYDEETLQKRLVRPTGARNVHVEFFGEIEAGHFAAYEREWVRRGQGRTVDDPREIVDHYADYGSWQQMPGCGVAGLVFAKDCRRVG